jgi:hypothetical protein
MNSLLGDRFLKRFAGEIRHKLKDLTSKTEGQKPDGDGIGARPDNRPAETALGSEVVESEETRQGSRSNGSEGNDG